MINIYAFTCGQVGVDPCVPDRTLSKNPVAYTGLLRSSNRRIWLPVKTFLIRHPKGNVLIDTGWDKEVRGHPVRTITFPMWFASKPKLPQGQSIDEQLAKYSLSAADLDYVIMTHMDIDHNSGLRLVKAAKNIYASKEEWDAVHSRQIRYARKPWKGIGFSMIPFAVDADAPYGKSWDIFADGTVKAVFLPGHSAGSIVVKVRQGEKFVLIAGDTGYNKSSWQKLKLPGPVYDKQRMLKSLEWVKAQSESPNCIAILASHDAEEQRDYFEL